MKYRAVLFDLDGTLLNTLEDITGSVNNALSRLGFPQHDFEAYKYFIGDGREALAARALPDHHRDAATVAKLVAHIDEEYAQHWSDNTHPYKGVPDLLDRLATRGVNMAVLSNKPHDFTELMVSRFLCNWRFGLVVGALPSVPRKPDPTAALEIAKRLDVQPREFLYVGDSDVDMKTATAAGMYAIGVVWGFRSAAELLSGGAKALIENPVDLLDAL